MVPGVKAAKALVDLLRIHPKFSEYEIVNVAGEGDQNEELLNALEKVNKAIGKDPDKTKTITISCGRLTTGVTVPAWTAVLMLSGSTSTSASSYLQTIFRVQNPAIIGGKMKKNSYVFDFAPDRVLKIIVESMKVLNNNGNNGNNNDALSEFLNFCPVIGYKGAEMTKYQTEDLVNQVYNVMIEKIVKNGFDDINLFDKNSFSCTKDELISFEKLKNILKANKNILNQNVQINKHDLDIEIHSKKINELKEKFISEEQQEIKRKNNLKYKAILILRNIAIRIPLMIYGLNTKKIETLDIQNFSSLFDEESWNEFMPKGITKEHFNDFTKYFNKDIFVAAAKKIHMKLEFIKNLDVLEKVFEITKLFSTFKNPDSETVLTPWLVINKHLGQTLGGYVFYNNENEEELLDYDENIRLFYKKNEIVKKLKLTENIYSLKAKILDINSKTGLYLLFVAYNIFQHFIDKGYKQNREKLWQKIIENNVFAICRTKMAAAIVRRTLAIFENYKVNIIINENIVKEMGQQYPVYFKMMKKIKNSENWNIKDKNEIVFDVIVGNPPYQGNAKQQIYTDFYLLSRKIGNIVSLIFPTGWQEAKNTNNLQKMNTNEIKKDKQIVFIDNRQNIFKGIAGAEWTNFILWIKNYDNKLNGRQLFLKNGKNKEIKILPILKSEMFKNDEILKLADLVETSKKFISITKKAKNQNNYNLATNIFDIDRINETDIFLDHKDLNYNILVYGAENRRRKIKFLKNFQTSKKTFLNKYKVFIPYAWGDMNEAKYLGGSYSDIIIASPNEIATSSFIEQMSFETFEEAQKYAKYLMTKFLRALLYKNKFSHHARTAWYSIPLQDFSEPWWEKSIEEIDKHLMQKYNIPNDIQEFVFKNIQPKSENNILNFKKDKK
ncbi:Eco57I restriction-modification methylase domain-containing protein [Mesomycoplasma neurolyticum]|uniref:Type II methyltransferase M.TaqI-like domain-containing protein n=1 Tax=Mesomycoplasma neurolyticum TaxID=2120 RepID=A0A449A5G7_9BACT|nr:Eco57I restriction-modification methylase domain-containing protein [Mesomycoplasma neurolyticum]VEU59530.1 Uncharacterised protein [Mesomycoplasma neurolyticum]